MYRHYTGRMIQALAILFVLAALVAGTTVSVAVVRQWWEDWRRHRRLRKLREDSKRRTSKIIQEREMAAFWKGESGELARDLRKFHEDRARALREEQLIALKEGSKHAARTQ